MNHSPIRLAWRIFVHSYETDESFAGLQQFLLAHREVVDEVAFFETLTHHLYLPLEVFSERAAVLKRRVQSLKMAGIPSVGINVLCTLGHLNEGWHCWPPLPFQPMMGHDGSLSGSCACPNTAEFRAYIRAKYRLMAEAQPDFIWVDDDIRMHHHGVNYACFCPACLAIFSRTTGREWERESLVAALDHQDGAALRQAWVRQNADTLTALLADVAETIHAVNPAIITGLMTAGVEWSSYSGYDFDRWFAALHATKGRPGGGYYSDHRPGEVIDKMIDIGRQLVHMPDTVTDRQYELENYPYCRLDKAAATVVNECTLALASGTNGIAFNALGALDGRQLVERQPLMEAIARHRPYWEAIETAGKGLPVRGLWPVWTAQKAEKQQVEAGQSWWAYDGRYSFNRCLGLAELGLPLCMAHAAADGVILTGRLPDLFTDEELREMLSGGVLLDTAALDVLGERGLGDLTGVQVAKRFDNGVKERFTADPLNGAAGATERYVNIEFWGDARGQADVLAPITPDVRILSELVNYQEEVHGPCMTAFENALGGRVVVAGFAPWTFLGSSAKRTQLQNIADWLTRGTLPLRIDSMVKMTPFFRLSADRTRGSLVLLNAGLDAIEQVELHLRIKQTPIRLARPGQAPFDIAPEWSAEGCRLTLRDIPAWSTLALLLGN